MGRLIEFPEANHRSMNAVKAAIESRYGVSYVEYIAFVMGYSGIHTDAIARKMDRAMQKEALLCYTKEMDE